MATAAGSAGAVEGAEEDIPEAASGGEAVRGGEDARGGGLLVLLRNKRCWETVKRENPPDDA